MTGAASLYIETQIVGALYDANLISNPDGIYLARRFISALDDRDIELRPR